MDASTADQTAELTLFRETVRRFFAAEVVPHITAWRKAGMVAREAWRRAGAAGLLCASMPAEFGGGGGDFRHEAILIEELAAIGFGDFAISLHNAIIAPYLLHYGTETQKHRWLPRMASGDMVAAIAMTEPDAGSDLQAIRTTARRVGDTYVLNGQKTFISNGQLADLVIVAAKTRIDAGAKGISLIAVETRDAPGFRRGRNLEKIGKHAQDTSELFFDDVVVPAENLLGGEPDRGFAQLMQQLPQERLVIAVGAVAAMEAALAETIAYVRSRRAFGKTLMEFQNTRFVLAEAKTTTQVARVFVDDCITRLLAGTLDVGTAAMAKYWTSEMQGKVIDSCLQLFGGYGFMAEYPIAQRYTDARVQRIYGGSNEIMKELIARSL
ncbi:MAG: acyl-CoA dehydrogenase family protein [Acidibrevibacterium sp.]|jgi:acyl-CoA dehydrogenase|uniref:acyl-CoA dehydrogenase family protein n=1 Tax=Acidibrevibacterium fodinaquatile TaxID=1969806 RepID=UPI0023A808B7|nr:acyl-CoA dehydrogenase family protein [Acidibrevibacterium fodinaquatile]MCA7119751.1 acyl-CoA dehydrogenase family protein [Acidibrevibacterium fodinaquatile]